MRISSFCLDVNSVAIRIGSETVTEDKRICKPYIGVGSVIGDETPITWPDGILREAGTGEPLLTPDGDSLLIAGS